jgi:hypothetical protein
MITNDQATVVAEALLADVWDSAPMERMMWRVAKTTVGGSRAELDVFIAVVMFGNGLLRVREALGKAEPFECENGPCPDCCEACAAATGGCCTVHAYDRPWGSDRHTGWPGWP